MFTLNMLKHNAFNAAMGREPWDFHTVEGLISLELAMLTARDLARSAKCYKWAEIGDGSEFLAIGQVFDEDNLMWAVR